MTVYSVSILFLFVLQLSTLAFMQFDLVFVILFFFILAAAPFLREICMTLWINWNWTSSLCRIRHPEKKKAKINISNKAKLINFLDEITRASGLATSKEKAYLQEMERDQTPELQSGWILKNTKEKNLAAPSCYPRWVGIAINRNWLLVWKLLLVAINFHSTNQNKGRSPNQNK